MVKNMVIPQTGPAARNGGGRCIDGGVLIINGSSERVLSFSTERNGHSDLLAVTLEQSCAQQLAEETMQQRWRRAALQALQQEQKQCRAEQALWGTASMVCTLFSQPGRPLQLDFTAVPMHAGQLCAAGCGYPDKAWHGCHGRGSLPEAQATVAG
jgi:hypothetical protein